jgi:zeta-carotene desaturase
MSSKSVIVVGGGLGGLSAGIALAESGYRVRLFERRPFLGGRATSYVLPSGEQVDNCQHVTLGCCTNLEDFYCRVGATHKLRFFDRLIFVDARGRRGIVKPSFLPAPFHLALSFAFFPLLGWKDKQAIRRAMMEIVRAGGRLSAGDAADGLTMLEWLRRHGQTQRAIERYWRVVLVSALDEELDRADARYGIAVFWKAFLANRRGCRMGVPAVPLAELYDGCRGVIERLGGEVHLRAPVRSVVVADGRLRSVQLDEGREESADFYVLAVPHDAVGALLPREVAGRSAAIAGLANLRVSPITGVHLWFDRVVLRDPFLTMLGTTSQWVFNKSALYGGADREEAVLHQKLPPEKTDAEAKLVGASVQYLQIVISASYDLVGKTRQEIIDLCLEELSRALPAAREARLVKATVVKEASATFSPAPSCDRWRPGQKGPVAGLYLAGDWTATGWPATMEGAVRSGYLAAEAILAEDGRPRQFVQPDLSVETLVRWLARR